jgi:hypothetical protein
VLLLDGKRLLEDMSRMRLRSILSTSELNENSSSFGIDGHGEDTVGCGVERVRE